MEQAIEKVIKRRELLLVEIEEINTFLRLYEKYSSNHSLENKEVKSMPTKRGRKNGKLKSQVASTAETILKEYGSLDITAITEKIQEKGITLNVEHPIARVSQILSSDERFESDRQKGWFLKDGA